MVLGRELAAVLTGAAPDTPLRTLRRRAEPLLDVAVEDPGVVLDLNTPDDLKLLRAAAGDPPSDGLP